MLRLHAPSRSALRLLACLAALAHTAFGASCVPQYKAKPDPSILSCSPKAKDSCYYPANGIVVLALSWAPSVGPSNKFTIHGLWPNQCNGVPINDCFEPKGLSSALLQQKLTQDYPDVLGRMNTLWPSVAVPNINFWYDEYAKHGTCLTTINPDCFQSSNAICSAISYYKQALDLADKYDLYAALKSQKILPDVTGSKSFQPQQILDGLRKAYPNLGITFSCQGMVGDTQFEVKLSFKVKARTEFVEYNDGATLRCNKGRIGYTKKING